MSLPSTPLATGRTAEIYHWGEGRILKLVRPGFPAHLADQEWRHASIARACGAPAPQPIELLNVGGRRGVVFERIDGPTMTQRLKRALWRISAYGKQLGRLHAQLHTLDAPALPSLRERRKRNLAQSAFLPDEFKDPLLELLEQLPDADTICHADFHPENILFTRKGPLIIDWEGSMHGPSAADVANTLLWISAVFTYGSGISGWWMRQLGSRFERAYLETYRRAAPTGLDHLEEWMAIQAANRMSDYTHMEFPRLLALIRGVVEKMPSGSSAAGERA